MIRVSSHLDIRRAQCFDGMSIEPLNDNETLISGYIIDQAALYSILSRIRDMGLILLEVKKIDFK